MPAYYVSSGNLQVKIIAPTPYEAAISAFKKQLSEDNLDVLGLTVQIDECGYNLKSHTKCVATIDILKELGIEDGAVLDPDIVDNIMAGLGYEDQEMIHEMFEQGLGIDLDNLE